MQSSNPILTRARAPSNIRLGERYLLYFTDVETGAIGVAEDAPAAPSESF